MCEDGLVTRELVERREELRLMIVGLMEVLTAAEGEKATTRVD
jgi:hypothetical protein